LPLMPSASSFPLPGGGNRESADQAASARSASAGLGL
jgi:hypothetical protein